MIRPDSCFKRVGSIFSYSKLLTVGLCFSTQVIAAGAPTYFTDVRPLMEKNCIICHSEKGVSFSFEDAESSYAYRMAISQAVAQGRMPPWMAEAGHQTYEGDYSLTPKERELIATWAKNGYPKGDQLKAPKAETFKAVDEFVADVSFEVLPNDSYLPNQERKDDYRCFVIDWPYSTTKYVTGFKGLPGNLRIAHHLITYAVTPEVAPVFKRLAVDEGGKGYSCFGGPVPDKLANAQELEKFKARYNTDLDTLNANNYWLSHWAPGMTGYSFPEGTGVLMKPGSAIVIQVHYYSAFAPGESDRDSIMQYQIKDHVEKPALIYPLSNYAWLTGKQNKSMVIPPGEKRTFYASDSFDKIANLASMILDLPKNEISAMELHSANIHMHAYGAAGNTSMVDTNGAKETLLNIPRWDLDWQRDFGLTQPKVIDAKAFSSTELTVECDFINHQDYPIYGGFGSDDEMCFNFSYIAVKRDSKEQVAISK